MKPERDPEVCAVCGAEGELVATPEGALCREHADDLADALRRGRGAGP